MITTSRRQGQDREELSEGSRSAKSRADEQKRNTRLSNSAELTHDNEGIEFKLHSPTGISVGHKSGGCVMTGHVLIWGDLKCERCANTAQATAMVHVSFQKTEKCSCIFGIHAIHGVISSGRSNANCRNATRMKDQRSRTKQRTIVLIDRRRSRPREVVSGA